MTHSIDTPFPPPAPMATDSPSTADVAKDEAKNVQQTAVQAGSQVASTATDQAKEVVQETQRQAKDLLDQGRTQVREQAISQQQKAGQSLSSLAQELRGLADGTSSGAPGPARDLLQQGAGMVETSPASCRTASRPSCSTRSAASPAASRACSCSAPPLPACRRPADPRRDGRAQRLRPVARGTTGYRAQSNYVDPTPTYVETTSTYTGTGAGYSTAGSAPLPPPPYGTVPPEGSVVPPRLRPAGTTRPVAPWGGLSDEFPLLRRHPGGLDPEHPGGRLHRPGAAELRR